MKIGIFLGLMALVTFWEATGRARLTVWLVLAGVGVSAIVFREQGILLSVVGFVVVWSAACSNVFGLRIRERSRLNVNIVNLGILVLSLLAIAISMLGFGEIPDGGAAENVSVTLFAFSAASFLYVCKDFLEDPREVKHACIAFALGACAQALIVCIQVFGIAIEMPQFISGSVVLVDETANQLSLVERYGGLVGDYELIVDFALMTLGVAALLAVRFGLYLLSSLTVVSSLVLGVASGTRSFILALVLAVLLVGITGALFFRRRSNRLFLLGGGAAPLLLLTLAWVLLSQSVTVFQRLDISFEALESDQGFEHAVNRSYAHAIDVVQSNIGVLGGGANLFTTLLDTEIVSHNVFLAIYCRYGMPGLVGIGFLLFRTVGRFRWLFKRAIFDRQRLEVAILASCTAALFFQEMKVSALRSSVGILLYCFWFLLIFGYRFDGKARPSHMASGDGVIRV